MMIRQVNVDADDVRAGDIATSDDRVDRATKSMCRRRRTHSEAVAFDNVMQMNRMRVDDTIKSDVEVAGDVDRLLVDGDNVQDCREFVEEGGLNGARPRTIDDRYNASET